MHGPSDTLASGLAPPPPSAPKNVEESRQQRMQRQQARFRDRGGIFVPTTTNTLADILLGRRQQLSPRKDRIVQKSRSRSRSVSPVKRKQQQQQQQLQRRSRSRSVSPVKRKQQLLKVEGEEEEKREKSPTIAGKNRKKSLVGATRALQTGQKIFESVDSGSGSSKKTPRKQKKLQQQRDLDEGPEEGEGELEDDSALRGLRRSPRKQKKRDGESGCEMAQERPASPSAGKSGNVGGGSSKKTPKKQKKVVWNDDEDPLKDAQDLRRSPRKKQNFVAVVVDPKHDDANDDEIEQVVLPPLKRVLAPAKKAAKAAGARATKGKATAKVPLSPSTMVESLARPSTSAALPKKAKATTKGKAKKEPSLKPNVSELDEEIQVKKTAKGKQKATPKPGELDDEMEEVVAPAKSKGKGKKASQDVKQQPKAVGITKGKGKAKRPATDDEDDPPPAPPPKKSKTTASSKSTSISHSSSQPSEPLSKTVKASKTKDQDTAPIKPSTKLKKRKLSLVIEEEEQEEEAEVGEELDIDSPPRPPTKHNRKKDITPPPVENVDPDSPPPRKKTKIAKSNLTAPPSLQADTPSTIFTTPEPDPAEVPVTTKPGRKAANLTRDVPSSTEQENPVEDSGEANLSKTVAKKKTRASSRKPASNRAAPKPRGRAASSRNKKETAGGVSSDFAGDYVVPVKTESTGGRKRHRKGPRESAVFRMGQPLPPVEDDDPDPIDFLS